MKETDIAVLKAQIIIYGIDFQDCVFENCKGMKGKKKCIRPEVINRQVYDVSGQGEQIPSEIILQANGKRSLVKTRHNAQSPVKAVQRGEALELLFTSSQYVCGAELVPENQVLKEEIEVKGKRFVVGDFLSILGMDRISMLLFDGCGNWNMGAPCKFCDMHPKPKQQKVSIPTVNELYGNCMDTRSWWNKKKEIFLDGLCMAYRKVVHSKNFGPHCHNFLMAGSLPDASLTWEFAAETVNALQKELTGDLIVNLQPHSDVKILERLKQLGVGTVQYNIEVFGEKEYHRTCPSKISYHLLLEKMKEAVEVFGPGNVRSNFVLGLQPLEDVYSGIEMLSEMGVVADYSIFQPKKNTAYENRKTADLSDVLDASGYLCRVYQSHQFRPIFCSLSSRSSIMNEMYDAYEKND